jgi:hypothetical protein
MRLHYGAVAGLVKDRAMMRDGFQPIGAGAVRPGD